MTTVNINGGVLSTAVAADQGYNLTVNMTAGTMSTSVAGGHFAMGPSVGSTYAVFNITGAMLVVSSAQA